MMNYCSFCLCIVIYDDNIYLQQVSMCTSYMCAEISFTPKQTRKRRCLRQYSGVQTYIYIYNTLHGHALALQLLQLRLVGLKNTE